MINIVLTRKKSNDYGTIKGTPERKRSHRPRNYLVLTMTNRNLMQDGALQTDCLFRKM